MLRMIIVFCSLLFSAANAFAHEFWIEPQEYQVDAGENIVASLKAGQKFKGNPFSFLPQRFVRFDLVKGSDVIPVEGRIGDRPAMNMSLPETGLWVVVHETTDSKMTWREFEKFEGFVAHKKLGDTVQMHFDRGLPTVGFRETYRRFVKALVGVGDAKGADQPVGLRTEFVALANPYTDDLSNGFPVQVLFEGRARAHAKVEIFEKDKTGAVRVSTVQTDSDGRAVIPVLKGREYLLDAVKMLPFDAANPLKDPSWYSLWAALTFKVPD